MYPANHTQLLNYLIEKYNLKSYLEIGISNPANNFDKIKCDYKMGVDPEVKGYKNIYTGTSDDFFNNDKFSGHWGIIFLDGLHHADQVKRDFDNSLRCLNDGGFIVIHDTLPENEEGTLVPRQVKRWWGSVYKFAMSLGNYNDLHWITLNMDEGCTIVWKSENPKINTPVDMPITWDLYKQIGSVLLNTVSPQEFFK